MITPEYPNGWFGCDLDELRKGKVENNMSEQQWSGWINWNGSKVSAPVPPFKFVEIQTRDGDIEDGEATAFYWLHKHLPTDIVAYRYKIDQPEVTEEEERAWAEKYGNEVPDPEAEEKERAEKYSAYFKDVRHLDYIDVYRTVSLFDCDKHGHALSHAAKKLLLTGNRTGGKDVEKDVREAIDSLRRWLEMRKEDKGQAV